MTEQQQQADPVQIAILHNVNGQLSRALTHRVLFMHRGWFGGGANGFQWISSKPVTTEQLTKHVRSDLVGEIAPITEIDDHIDQLPEDLQLLKIDPCGPISLALDKDELFHMREFARGIRIERAMREHDWKRVRAYREFMVPYMGELGNGHQIVAPPTDHGPMIAAFTTHDAVHAFLDRRGPDARERVKFVMIPGDALFGDAGPRLAKGVIVNIDGPRTYGFEAPVCEIVAKAT